LPPKDDPKFLAFCVLSENLPQNDFGELPHHPLEMNTRTILNGPTSRYPMDLNQVSMVHFYLSTIHEVQFLTNDQWHVSQEIRHIVFQESFVIPFFKPVWMYMGSE
jgi:hypothetical protein